MVGGAKNLACFVGYFLCLMFSCVFLEVPRARPRPKTGGGPMGQGLGPLPVLGLGLALGTSSNMQENIQKNTQGSMPNS